MNIYEIINSKEFIGKDISFYLFSELAVDLIGEIYRNDQYIENIEYYEETLDENEIVIVSKLHNSDGWFVEPLSYGDGQIYNEIDIALIQEEIVDEIDYENLECERILSFAVEEYDENDEMIEDVLEEVMDRLSNEDNCPCCVLRDALRDVFDFGRLSVVSEIDAHTECILDSIIN